MLDLCGSICFNSVAIQLEGINMFFREKTSKKSKLPILQLVENMRTDTGSKQKLIVSLGSKLKIPKENRREVAQIVKDRLTGPQRQL